MIRTTLSRAFLAAVALLVLTASAGLTAEDERISMSELDQRCEENTRSSTAKETCLAALRVAFGEAADDGSAGAPQDPSSAGEIPGTGIFIVGMDISPGTYRTQGPTSSSCYYARLSGFSGTLADIIANGNAGGPAVVTVSPTDAAFETSRCQPWEPVDIPDTVAPGPSIAAPIRTEQPGARFYRVKAGDTLTSIAQRFILPSRPASTLKSDRRTPDGLASLDRNHGDLPGLGATGESIRIDGEPITVDTSAMHSGLVWSSPP